MWLTCVWSQRWEGSEASVNTDWPHLHEDLWAVSCLWTGPEEHKELQAGQKQSQKTVEARVMVLRSIEGWWQAACIHPDVLPLQQSTTPGQRLLFQDSSVSHLWEMCHIARACHSKGRAPKTEQGSKKHSWASAYQLTTEDMQNDTSYICPFQVVCTQGSTHLCDNGVESGRCSVESWHRGIYLYHE